MAADPSDLRRIQDNGRIYLEQMLDDYSTDRNDGPALAVMCHGAAHAHHNLAILAFLLDGDARSYFDHLFCSARCKHYYLLKVAGGVPFDASYMVATDDDFLFDGIASGHWDAARRLSRVMSSRKHPNLDSMERFAFSTGVRVLLDEKASSVLKESCDTALSSADRGDPRIRCVNAIRASDARAFAAAFDGVLNARQRDIETSVITNEPDQLLFVEGLALLRVAMAQGVDLATREWAEAPRELLANPTLPTPTQGFPVLTEDEKEALRRNWG